MSRGTTIVGMSALYHDSACCLLRDGELLCAVEEERLSRVKHDRGLPWRAFRFCLEHAGVSIDEVDCLAFYEQPAAKLERLVWTGLQPGCGEVLERALGRIAREGFGEAALREALGFDGRVETVGHHLSHAASAYYFSGFSDAAVLTVDGVGEWATTTFGRARSERVELLGGVDFPHSLGLLYSAITAYLGFEVNEGEYKVMGLAPYGEPRYLDRMRRLVEAGPDGQLRLRLEYFDFLRGRQMFSPRLPELFGQAPRAAEAELEPFHCDVARSLQAVLEEALLALVRHLHDRVGGENLCMAGGVALNCVANGRILRDGPFERLFVPPAAGDAGGALGAAAAAHVRLTGRHPGVRRLEHARLGPAWPAPGVARLLEGTSAGYSDFRADPDALLEATVDRLVEGRVVGWFHGRMEFGPRALGARSILADPRRADMRDRINALVKKRESFRPFAPAVLEARAGEHFDLDHPSPFMLETCPVTSPIELPAITHVDGSARVQTVADAASPRFAALIRAFERRTGCPILLNTSFNVRGEPIVCTPVDAIRCFARSGLDALVLEDFLVDRDGLPAAWLETVERRGSGAPSAVSHDIYALL